MHKTRVALIGANSRIGPAILNALLDAPSQPDITILVRPTSQPVPSNPRIHRIVVPSDPPTLADLTAALADIDVLVCALSPGDAETQIRLADACVAAGVERFVPADYGSMRSDDPVVLDILPNFRNKQRIREHCIKLAEKHAGEFSWTSLATGHFFDYGLHTELLGLDVEQRTALLFDGGEKEWSASTTWQIGKAVAGILENLGGTANQMLLVHSFRTSQVAVIKAIEQLKGRGKFQTTEVETKRYIKEKRALADKGDAEAVEELVAVLGILRSDWKGDKLFANELLGLKEEDMGEVVQTVLGQ